MRRWLRPVEIGLWFLGLLCLTSLALNRLEVASAQKAAAAFNPSTRSIPAGNGAAAQDVAPPDPDGASRIKGGILGRLEIPALDLQTPIIDDDDTRSLLRGAGHIRGTAMPGGLGNFVIAAHRDTYFRPLQGIKPGMKILVVTPETTYVYIVDSTSIVTPDQVEVLNMGDVPQMTLITCYPFHYIGAAPKRFTVLAHLTGF